MTSYLQKLVFIFILLLAIVGTTKSQELKVMGFSCLTQDLSARTHLRTDMNGDPCALIKVQIPGLNNVNFEGWVVDQSYTPGEYAVYVPAGTRKIIIKHTNFLPLEYIFPEKIEGKMTYRMILQIPSDLVLGNATVHLQTNVKKATLYIGDNQYKTENAQFSFPASQGTYPIKISADEAAFLPYEGKLSVAAEPSFQEYVYNLQPLSQYNVFYTSEPGTTILVDGEKVTKIRNNTFSVPSGIHNVEVRYGDDSKWFRQVQIDGVSDNISVDLSLSGSVRFVEPRNATFKISPVGNALKPSRSKVKTGETVRLLGDYKLSISKKGYNSRTIDMSIGVGSIIDNFSVKLDCKADALERNTQYSQAYREYCKMASRNDEYALYKVGEYLYYGRGVAMDSKLAIEKWKESASAGSTDAMMRLYKESSGSNKLHWLMQAVQAGVTEAKLEAGRIYSNPPHADYEKALSLLMDASHHNPYANYDIGELYYNGKGVDKNVQTAKIYYERGSCAGDERCDERLADYLYDAGDVDKACAAYLKLSSPSSLAHFKIATWFYSNKDYLQAGKQLLLINISDIKNTADLGKMFHKVANQVYKEDKVMACNLHEIALTKLNYNYKDAYYHLGLYYEQERKNGFQAFSYYSKGAEMQDSKSMCRLGYCYETGLGTRKDYTQAFKWYNAAIKAGNKQAYRYLGTLYINGHGVKKDEAKAVKLWQIGADAKDKGAIKQLIKYYTHKHMDAEAKLWQKKIEQIP